LNTAPVVEHEAGLRGAPNGANAWTRMGVRVPDTAGQAAASRSSSHAPNGVSSWSGGVLRAARYAAVGITLLTALPLGMLALKQRNFLLEMSFVRERVMQVDALRALRVPTNAAVTPEIAGEALARLFPVDARGGFVPRHVIPKSERPSQLLAAIVAPVNADGNANAEGAPWWGPKHEQIIRRAAAGVSPQEREVLRRIATAPLWQTVDMIAAAPSADIVGGKFRTPFAPGVQSYAMPIGNHLDMKTVLYASLSRAAYFVSRGEYGEAELALRRALSIGFVLIDNGVTPFDAIMGRMFVGVSHKALQELAQIPSAKSMLIPLPPLAEFEPRRANGAQASGAGFEEVRASELRDIANPSLPRTLRMSSLEALQWSTCGSLREAVLGPSAEVLAANAAAVASLGRTAAEREYVRLLIRPRTFEASGSHGSPVALAAAGAAQIVSTVTGNPHFAACTRVALDMR